MVKFLTKNKCIVEGTLDWALRAQELKHGYIINEDGTKMETKTPEEKEEEKKLQEVKKKKDISKGFKNAKKK